jgi:hypothetical protein
MSIAPSMLAVDVCSIAARSAACAAGPIAAPPPGCIGMSGIDPMAMPDMLPLDALAAGTSGAAGRAGGWAGTTGGLADGMAMPDMLSPDAAATGATGDFGLDGAGDGAGAVAGLSMPGIALMSGSAGWLTDDAEATGAVCASVGASGTLAQSPHSKARRLGRRVIVSMLMPPPPRGTYPPPCDTACGSDTPSALARRR